MSMTPRSTSSWTRSASHHVEQCVVERADVGVNLLLERAGQEAQVLTGLHGRAREDDATDVAALQGAHGHGHGQIGLAGARGPKAKRHGVVADALDVAALTGGLGANGLAVIREQDVIVRAQCARVLAAKGADETLDVVGTEAITLTGGSEQLLEHARRSSTSAGSPAIETVLPRSVRSASLSASIARSNSSDAPVTAPGSTPSGMLRRTRAVPALIGRTPPCSHAAGRGRPCP